MIVKQFYRILKFHNRTSAINKGIYNVADTKFVKSEC